MEICLWLMSSLETGNDVTAERLMSHAEVVWAPINKGFDQDGGKFRERRKNHNIHHFISSYISC